MRIGVFGGSFDPIHNGHLILALTAREALQLDQVLFVVAGEPQLKASPGASAEQRFTMVELALTNLSGLKVDRTELDSPGPSFTVQTLRVLRSRFPADELVLLLGRDAAIQLPQWREPEEIARLALIAVTRRGGEAAPPGFQAYWDMPQLMLSSTQIRARAAADLPLAGWVPERVADYIKRLRIYRSNGGC